MHYICRGGNSDRLKKGGVCFWGAESFLVEKTPFSKELGIFIRNCVTKGSEILRKFGIHMVQHLLFHDCFTSPVTGTFVILSCLWWKLEWFLLKCENLVMRKTFHSYGIFTKNIQTHAIFTSCQTCLESIAKCSLTFCRMHELHSAKCLRTFESCEKIYRHPSSYMFVSRHVG